MYEYLKTNQSMVLITFLAEQDSSVQTLACMAVSLSDSYQPKEKDNNKDKAPKNSPSKSNTRQTCNGIDSHPPPPNWSKF